MARQARFSSRLDDITTNFIERIWRSEPHVIDPVTDKEYGIAIDDGNITVVEQSDPTTQIPSNVGIAIGGRDILRYAFFLSS